MREPETVDDVAAAIQAALEATPSRQAEALRKAFDFVGTFDRATPEQRARMVAERPRLTGDPGHDAMLAALVEHLCARWDVGTPGWVEDAERFLEPWWFVSGLSSLHASALAQSPISFARHGVFLCDGALSYA